MKTKLVTVVCVVLLTFAALTAAYAAQKGDAPALKFSAFEWKGPVDNALSTAETALRGSGLRVTPQKGWERFGSSAKVVVLVTCAAISRLETRVVVVATSTDSETATEFRNDVQSRIERTPPKAQPSRID